ncbi:FAD-dependent oxidoreductase [Pseudomonas sp. Z1-12]|uniref:FAD-dependent oxidoreductase n=1 Tax=Pseudomonas sp. Z1-12 TaxID=2817408 RepID=UPI003DA7F9EF
MEIGAETDQQGALRVDAHQGTTVQGLYAVGDVVDSLKQISVATGQAAVCATAVHNSQEVRLWTERMTRGHAWIQFECLSVRLLMHFRTNTQPHLSRI